MGFMRVIPAAQTSDLEAYNRLVTDIQDGVYTLAYVILGNKTAAERAVQSAFMQAYQGQGSRKFASHHLLVYRALVNVCQQELKGGKNGFPKVEQLTEEADGAVWCGLMHLPLDLRLAAALVDVAGLDYEQASEVLSVKVKEIRRRLAQARSSLVRPAP